MKLRVTIDGREFTVELSGPDGDSKALVDGREISLAVGGLPGSSEHGDEVVSSDGSRRVTASLVPGGVASDRGELRLLAGGRVVEARIESDRDRIRARSKPAGSTARGFTARSTLPGVIRRIIRNVGERVDEGDPILTLEAMKMENEVRAEATGRVRAILVREGQVVNAGDALAEVDAD